MSFKEQIQKDLDAVFLNLDEFAELHRIEADMLLMGRVTDFPADLEPGRLLNVDGRELIVANSGKDMGLVEVALRQNRTG